MGLKIQKVIKHVSERGGSRVLMSAAQTIKMEQNGEAVDVNSNLLSNSEVIESIRSSFPENEELMSLLDGNEDGELSVDIDGLGECEIKITFDEGNITASFEATVQNTLPEIKEEKASTEHGLFQNSNIPKSEVDIIKLLTFSANAGSSDLHVSAGEPVIMRVDGDVTRITDYVIDRDLSEKMIREIMSEAQQEEFDAELESDFSMEIPGVARFRVNAFRQNRGWAAVIRTIPSEILSMEQLGMGEIFKKLSSVPRGLVVVTGPTGSGKSTTLAAMIDYINTYKAEHILTIEDPIEFVHKSKKSLINQREVKRDTLDFNAALKSALREDPDIILVGELRDLETIKLAMTAAETGHVVFGTLHTTSAAKTIDRIIDVFPAAEKPMIRSMISESLQGVISQTLLKKEGGGRVAAHEIMVGTPAIRNLIKEDKIPQMYSAIQTGGSLGMQTLDQCLEKLLKQGLISLENAKSKAKDPDKLGRK